MTYLLKFGRYDAYSDLGTGGKKRPYIAVRLQNGGNSIDTVGIVDSGADFALFNLDFALALGLTPDAAHEGRMTGVGGDIPIWTFDIFMSIGGHRFPATVGFAAGWEKGFGLLGREDFFRAFRVGFEQRDQKVFYHQLP